MTGLAANALPLLFLTAPPVLLIAGIVLAVYPREECRAAGAVREGLGADGAGPTSGEVFRAMYRLYGRRHLR